MPGAREVKPAGLVGGGTLPPLGAGALPKGTEHQPRDKEGTRGRRSTTTIRGEHAQDQHQHHNTMHCQCPGTNPIALPPARAPVGVFSRHELCTQGSVHCSVIQTKKATATSSTALFRKKASTASSTSNCPTRNPQKLSFLHFFGDILCFQGLEPSPFLSCKIVALSLSR